jgi:hypothetical protein
MEVVAGLVERGPIGEFQGVVGDIITPLAAGRPGVENGVELAQAGDARDDAFDIFVAAVGLVEGLTEKLLKPFTVIGARPGLCRLTRRPGNGTLAGALTPSPYLLTLSELERVQVVLCPL